MRYAARLAAWPPCAEAGLRLKRLKEEPDSYKRDEWYRNWWLADTNADIPAVVEQLKMHLGCED